MSALGNDPFPSCLDNWLQRSKIRSANHIYKAPRIMNWAFGEYLSL